MEIAIFRQFPATIPLCKAKKLCYNEGKQREVYAMLSREAHVLPTSSFYNFSPSELARAHFLYVLCVGDFTYEAGYDLQRASFDGLLLEVILSGEVQFETEGEAFTAHADQVVMLDSTKPHRYHSDTGWHALWVHLDGPAARGYWHVIQRQNGRVFSTHRLPVIRDALSSLFNMFHEHHLLSETTMALLLTQALTAMTEPPAAINVSSGSDRTSLIDRCITHIHQSIGHEPSIAELAKGVGMSEYHFIRVFRSAIGQTPRQYIIANRMAHARYLLRTTQLPVSEISGMVGYSSESMFTAAFHRTQGITPTACRKEAHPTTQHAKEQAST